jgi:hypothetical protein
MSVANVTATEVFESMTGYEELAIAKAFGVNPNDYDEDSGNSKLVGTLLGRSLVFLHARREGKADAEALDVALGLTMPDLIDYFIPEVDEEAGKDSAQPEPQPENSQPSAS